MKEKIRYHPAFHFYGFPKEVNPLYEANKYDKALDPLELPYIKYCLSDKSMYPKASTKYIDPDDDFLLYTNDDILMNINFVFVNVHLFSEVANHFELYDRYCDFDKHSREYKEFWGRETYRRKNGLTRNCKLLFDDIEEYNVGKILPVFIFVKNGKEISRLCGEHKKEEFTKIIEENI